MGSIGWDGEQEWVEQQARQAREDAGVDASKWRGLCAVREKGSLAELVFNRPDDIETAKILVRRLKRTVGQAKNPIWLDFKKS
eukprot:10995807-Karenia_brevis.AAC.1